MSRKINNIPKRTPIVAGSNKAYCKVCFESGKSESEYTSHWVRSLPDQNGKTVVTCPTLLNTECRYCSSLGHTVKFCPAIKQKQKESERAKRAVATEKPKPKVEPKKTTSAFSALMDESDSEPENEVVVASEATQAPKQSVKSWASIAAKPAEIVEVKRVVKEKRAVQENKLAPWAKKEQVVAKSKWADLSDSEDEEDEYEEYAVGSVEEYDNSAW